MRHEFWFGTSPAGRHPRCPCGWSGTTNRTLMAAVLTWIGHTGFMHRPMVKLVAEVDERWNPEPPSGEDTDG